MSAVVKLVQGTAEWHAHRANFQNASESAAVMGLNPWQTLYQLWLVRTDRLPELKVVDLDRYRAAGRVEVRVTVAK